MTLNFAQTVLTDRLQALTRALDADAAPGRINLYSGPRPAPGANVTSQTLLASIPFQKPSSGGVVNNVLTLNYVAGPVLAVGTGVAVWARFVDGIRTGCQAHLKSNSTTHRYMPAARSPSETLRS